MSSKLKRTVDIKFTVDYCVYYIGGGKLIASTAAPTRSILLKGMKTIRERYKDEAEIITFESIKKNVTTKEAKGKYTVFRPASMTHDNLKKFYNEV